VAQAQRGQSALSLVQQALRQARLVVLVQPVSQSPARIQPLAPLVALLAVLGSPARQAQSPVLLALVMLVQQDPMVPPVLI
jgi:hypothetical protein